MKATFWKPKRNPFVGLIQNSKNIKNKDMNWVQAKSKYPKMKPFGDKDKDGLMNMYDCKPLNKKKKDLAGSPGLSFATPQKIVALQNQPQNIPPPPTYSQMQSPLQPQQPLAQQNPNQR